MEIRDSLPGVASMRFTLKAFRYLAYDVAHIEAIPINQSLSIPLVRIIRNYQIRNSGQETYVNNKISAYHTMYYIRRS